MIIPCQPHHAESIQHIFNDAILHTPAIYENDPRSLAWVKSWMESKEQNDFPLIGIEGTKGHLVAFATYGSFRAFPGYKYTVEHSIYVDKASRGQGFGKLLLVRLIELATQANYHTMIGVIDSTNKASIQLHLNNGFQLTGTLRQAGNKFGRWLDVDFYQLMLTNKNPA